MLLTMFQKLLESIRLTMKHRSHGWHSYSRGILFQRPNVLWWFSPVILHVIKFRRFLWSVLISGCHLHHLQAWICLHWKIALHFVPLQLSVPVNEIVFFGGFRKCLVFSQFSTRLSLIVVWNHIFLLSQWTSIVNSYIPGKWQLMGNLQEWVSEKHLTGRVTRSVCRLATQAFQRLILIQIPIQLQTYPRIQTEIR